MPSVGCAFDPRTLCHQCTPGTVTGSELSGGRSLGRVSGGKSDSLAQGHRPAGSAQSLNHLLQTVDPQKYTGAHRTRLTTPF